MCPSGETCLSASTMKNPTKRVGLGQKKMCVSDRPTNPKILLLILTFFYAKKKIDRQNPEFCLRFRVCFRLQQFSSFPQCSS